jgi:formylglycine-generating enzyme required for sulfatase activity
VTPAVARAGMAVAWDADLECVDRGGIWCSSSGSAATTYRYGLSPEMRLNGVGFRLVRDSTDLRTFRGGCHSFPADYALKNACYNHHSITRQDYLGIRLVADAPIKDRTR